MRSPSFAAEAAVCLETAARNKDVLLLDSSRGRLSVAARALLARLIAEGTARNLLTVTHYPPGNLPEDDRWLLTAAGRSGVIGLLVCGHMHCDRKQLWSGIRCETVRGLDPDKATGGPPAVAFFSRYPNGRWVRRNAIYRPADPAYWEDEARKSLADKLGLSGMSDPFGTLDFAVREKVPAFEWRYSPMPAKKKHDFKSLLQKWRQAGGQRLSVHCPDFGWSDGKMTGLDGLHDATMAAQELQADRITLHVPRVPVCAFADPATAAVISEQTARILRPLSARGIPIGIENLHMRPGEKDDPFRGFGYTPDEVLTFADMLTRRGAVSGVHLDLGHARNNSPFNNRFPISSWLARCGARINGCHLHQVTCGENGVMLNHQALTEPFGRLVSLTSLFLAWNSGQIPHVPLILEIRQGLGPRSWLCLNEYIQSSGRS